MIIQYQGAELDGLPITRFSQALHAEGCTELDRPGSTCPINLLPLFQEPGPLFPEAKGRFTYREGDYPRAETFHQNTLKLPVWHREQDQPLVDGYLDAFRKVIAHHHDLRK